MKNQKIILSVIVVSLILIGGANMAFAAGLTQSQINAIIGLLKSFGADSSVISNVQVSLSGGTPSISNTSPAPSPSPTPTISCVRFSHNLYLGKSDKETDNEVSKLQKFLKDSGHFTYPTITGYYGPATEQAVQKFQASQGVVSAGSYETTGYGVVGPKTQEKIVLISCGNQTPAITITTPTTGILPVTPPITVIPPVIVSNSTTTNSVTEITPPPAISTPTSNPVASSNALEDAKTAKIDQLKKEYGLKINTVNAQLIEANTLTGEDRAKEILRTYNNSNGQEYPIFADTDFKKEVIVYIYEDLNKMNPVGRGSGNVVEFLREKISILERQVSQLQNELQRKLLELKQDSITKEYELKINILRAQLIETDSLIDSSGLKAKEILRLYGNGQNARLYPDFVDTEFKQNVIDYVYSKLDTVNPVARSTSHAMTFIGDYASPISTQISQLQNELERKLLNSN